MELRLEVDASIKYIYGFHISGAYVYVCIIVNGRWIN